jgi:predicted house-cleaning noncanonical NTP pyrophosphatase (MazG superfamily)
MPISESAARLKVMIEKAIEDHQITRAEMDMILHIASEDSHIDRHEQALLEELQEMIETKAVKIIP